MREVNGVLSTVTNKAVVCDFFFSISHDRAVNETLIVGHIGKQAKISFINPGNPLFFSQTFFSLIFTI